MQSATTTAADLDHFFEIGVDDFDTSQVVERIRSRVRDNMEKGLYADLNVARAERTNLANLKDEDEFLAFYMDCLRETCFVDINDFEIRERRARLGKLLVALKTVIWKLLKFYTYRLWSQQNQINGLFLSTIELTESRYREKIEQLETRVAELEQRTAAGHDDDTPSPPQAGSRRHE